MMKMTVYGTETTSNSLLSGCDDDMQCSLSNSEICHMTEKVLSRTGLENFQVELSSCAMKCTEDGGGGGRVRSKYAVIMILKHANICNHTDFNFGKFFHVVYD